MSKQETQTPTMGDKIRAVLALPEEVGLDLFYSISIDDCGAIQLQGKAKDVIDIHDLSMEFADVKKSWDKKYPKIRFSRDGIAFEIIAA